MDNKNLHAITTGERLQQALQMESTNIVFNLASGLKPKDLTVDEVEILKIEIGEDWFCRLGYTDDVEKPKFL